MLLQFAQAPTTAEPGPFVSQSIHAEEKIACCPGIMGYGRYSDAQGMTCKLFRICEAGQGAEVVYETWQKLQKSPDDIDERKRALTK
ncbi:hypothetical protein EMCG_05082 [[Emmonsia] crescens]|uniref:Uncharacterized protein n=1 Tax=[Emmonsia] crescens TaxID=73230 RepID=A0A0G2HR38_9EURO|nr:hypothetical protein EMCG_05082 [Emmonsia crescens UAMH 3008]